MIFSGFFFDIIHGGTVAEASSSVSDVYIVCAVMAKNSGGQL